MLFSPRTLREAWKLAQGRCECQRDGHGHADRCGEPLSWQYCELIGPGGWQPTLWQPLSEGGKDAPENCEILCWKCAAANLDEASAVS